jgi:hypothetical protein
MAHLSPGLSMMAATLALALTPDHAPLAAGHDPFGRGPFANDPELAMPGRTRRFRPGGKQVSPAQRKAKRKQQRQSRAKNRKR